MIEAAAFTLRASLTDYSRKQEDKTNLRASLGNQAMILMDLGKLDEAMELLDEVVHTYRKLGDKDDLQKSLGNQALILKTWGRLKEAMERIKRVLA